MFNIVAKFLFLKINVFIPVNGNRIIWLRMTSPDRIMKLSIAGKTVSSVAVTLPGNSWSHVCLSYQSASGAWAIYVDGNIVECQASDVVSPKRVPTKSVAEMPHQKY